MTEKLKPCPFCAGRAIYTSVDGFDATTETYWCKCSECAPGEIVHTVDHWQTRPLEDAFRDALESVSGALHKEYKIKAAIRRVAESTGIESVLAILEEN